MAVAVLASWTVLSETEGVRWEYQRPAVSCQVALLPFPDRVRALRRPAFTFDFAFLRPFSFIFRDRSRRKEALVSRARGLDWSWTVLAVWADDNLDKDHGVRFQSPEDGTSCGGCFSEYWSDIIA